MTASALPTSRAGAPGFSPRVLFGVSRANLFGLGQSLSLMSRVSTVQQRVMTTYLAPQFEGNDDLSFSVSVLQLSVWMITPIEPVMVVGYAMR